MATPSPGFDRTVTSPPVLRALPRDAYWLSMVWMLADAALGVRDPEIASVLYELAVPFEDITIIDPGCIYLGSMHHHLGVMARTFGNRKLAVGHLRAGLADHQRANAQTWMERTEALLRSRH